ncbi:regulatory protein RecX [Sulfurivermis fontis]|uniref:regulatory protein RecX n=1 Tax=Sulfurivermis fontis TaxID=1972068 RepID=UPI000FDC324F|nr:regulatory protein RecX [Sulfurivermis fontis]
MHQQDDPYPRAIALLAQREHSARELERKLCDKGFPSGRVAECIARLQQERLQSDARYAESYVHLRAGKGYGPLRIRAELAERGVADEFIAPPLEEMDGQWSELAEQARRKRFGNKLPQDFQERARQARFLQYRGFATEHFRHVFSGDE